MPGLVGIVKRSAQTNYLSELESAFNLIKHRDFYKQDDIFEDDNIVASKMHLNINQPSNSPLSSNEYVCWTIGEVYNLQEAISAISVNADNLPAGIIEAEKVNKLEELLRNLDGNFIVVLYNKTSKNIKITSDRFGLYPFYLYQKDDKFAWSCESKAFLEFSDFEKKINKEALNSFIFADYFPADLTQWEYVKFFPAAMLMTYDLNSSEANFKRYWTFQEIKKQDISFDDAVDKLGELFHRAVDKRVKNDDLYSIGLSGGLDSRVILAEIIKLKKKFFTFTVGTTESADMVIATELSKKFNFPQHKEFISKDSFFEGKFEYLWMADGMYSLRHFHYPYALYNCKVKYGSDIFLSGFLGDVVLGTTYMPAGRENSYPDSTDTEIWFKKYNYLIDPKEPYTYVDTVFPFMSNHRGRKFINLSLQEYEVVSRKPFYDKDLIEFIVGIDDNYRTNNALYSRMLLKFHNKYFKHIPWQKTMKPVGGEEKSFVYFMKNFEKLIFRQLSKLMPIQSLRKKVRNFSLFHRYAKEAIFNYEDALMDKNINAKITEILSSENALYRQYINIDAYTDLIIPHLERKANNEAAIFNILTIEIWLQQVFNEKFRK